MIQVQGPDPTAVIKRARHHTKETVPLILEAAISLLLACPLARDEQVHILKQSRRGAESLGLHLADGREYHFRPGPGGHGATAIHVKDGYTNGKTVAELNGDGAIWDFFAGLSA